MIKKTKRGSGITERTYVVRDDLNTIGEKLSFLAENSSLATLEGRLDYMEAKARKALSDENLPFDAGSFHYVNWKTEQSRRRVMEVEYNFADHERLFFQLSGLIEELGYSFDSPIGYAANILDEIRLIRSLIADGDAEGAVLKALDLGAAFRESELKVIWDLPAIMGEKQRRPSTGPQNASCLAF